MQIKTELKAFIGLILILFLPIWGSTQEIPKIRVDDLTEKKHSIFEDAKAKYLIKNCEVFYNFKRHNNAKISKYFERIKIYNEDGLSEFGDFELYLSKSGNDKESIKNLKVKTYSLADGKQVVTELNKKDIFKEKGNENYNFLTFAFPNIKEGSIIEVSYTVTSPFLYSSPKHFFQTDIPVERSTFSISIPQYFTMSPIATGVVPLIKEQETMYYNNDNKFIYTANEVPPILDDEYVLNINDYRSSLKYEVHSTAFPNRPKKNYSESWESIAKQLSNMSKFGKRIRNSVKSSKEFLSSISTLDYNEKIVAIHTYVSNAVTWNRDYGIMSENKPNNILSEKMGNIADINLLLANLLNKAGVKAYPVVTRRRFDGLLNEFYPSLTRLNYVIVAIPKEENEGYIFMDASSKYYPVGELPIRAINLYGLLIDGEQSKLISIPNNNETNIKELSNLEIDTSEISLIGSGTLKLTGYAATKNRIKIDEDEEDEDNQNLDGDNDSESEEGIESEKENVNIREDINEYVFSEGIEDIYSNITYKYNTTLYKPIRRIGDEIFIDAFVIQEFRENPFKEINRDFPAYFNSKHNHNYITILKIPDGYELISTPSELSIIMEGDNGKFKYTTSSDGKSLTVRCMLKINSSEFVPRDYVLLRRFFDAVLNKQKEKFIFKKIK